MRPFLRVLGLARPHLAWLFVAALSAASVAAATVFAYNLLRPLLGELGGAHPALESAAPGAVIAVLDAATARAISSITEVVGGRRSALLVLVVVAVAVKAVLTLVARYSVARFGLATIRDLRVSLLDHLLEHSQVRLPTTTTTSLTTRLVADVELIRETLAERFADLVVDTVTVLALLVYILALNPRLSLVTALAAPLLLAPVVHLARRLRRRTRDSQDHLAAMASIFDETLRGLLIIQAYAMEATARRQFRAAADDHLGATLRSRLVQAANAPVMEVIGTVAGVVLVAWAGTQISRGTLTVGDLSAFLVAVYGAYNPIKRLNKLNLSLQQADVASARIFEVIDRPPEIRDRPDARPLTTVRGGIHLEGVGFAWEPGRWVLRDLELHIPEGATLALVGASGAGKSTLVQLIPRFLDPLEGRVLIGGHDVRGLTLDSVRAHIALVTQETVLFRQSVSDNLTGGRDIPAHRVEAAARAAGAHGFITALADGYATVLGEQGSTLSGGQRQRLAIARALLKEAPILLLDEATSALDGESEGLVQEGLRTLAEGRTTLIVAHRLSTVRRADRIAVLDDGRVIELGGHEELLAAGGVYRRLVEVDLEP